MFELKLSIATVAMEISQLSYKHHFFNKILYYFLQNSNTIQNKEESKAIGKTFDYIYCHRTPKKEKEVSQGGGVGIGVSV